MKNTHPLIPRRLRSGHAFMVVVTWLMAANVLAQYGYMPGETNPTDPANGFYFSDNRWFKNDSLGRRKAVTGADVSEFRVIDGKPFWKSGRQYYYNSMGSETANDWGFRGSCTERDAECFFVFGGKVFYRIGNFRKTYYCNSLSTYSSSTWGDDGPCTASGTLEVQVVGEKVFYRIGTETRATFYCNNLASYSSDTGWGNRGPCTISGVTGFGVSGGDVFYRIGNSIYTYYYNDLSVSPSNTNDAWGRDGACTQRGATEFQVSDGKPYWRLNRDLYCNTLRDLFDGDGWRTKDIVAELPEADDFDPAYRPCDYGFPLAPTGIALSNVIVFENQPPGTPVGTLTTTGANLSDMFTYTLVSGAGSTDNASFTINGSTLQTAASFNHEATSNLSVRVRTSDEIGLSFEKAFTITVLDQEEPPFPPTDITLSNATVLENQPPGTPVGALSTTDLTPGDTFTYTLVNGAGNTDNGSFTIDGNTLQAAACFNYEATSSVSVRVRSTDQTGLWVEKAFAITILDQEEPPFQILDISGDFAIGFTIRWTTEFGYSYQVQFSDTLQNGDWQNFGSAQLAHCGQTEMNDTNPPPVPPNRFYRIVRTTNP